MKNKIQQKIYAIWQTLKTYASKLRISSFVGGQFKERQTFTNEDIKIIMTDIKQVSERLRKRLIYLKDNKTVVETITNSINELKYTKTGKTISLTDKNKIIDEIDNGLLLVEDTSSDKLKILLTKIKEKINGK